MTALTPSVFDFVEDYATELADRDRLPATIDEDGALLVFTREFFIQFFGDVFDYQVSTFGDTAAVDVAVADKDRNPDGSSADQIVAMFRQFCQDYATIVTDQYDPEVSSTFHDEFVPPLLEAIREWAVAEGDRSDIADAAEHALGVINRALAKVAEST
jgi:hypothetical protein